MAVTGLQGTGTDRLCSAPARPQGQRFPGCPPETGDITKGWGNSTCVPASEGNHFPPAIQTPLK